MGLLDRGLVGRSISFSFRILGKYFQIQRLDSLFYKKFSLTPIIYYLHFLLHPWKYVYILPISQLPFKNESGQCCTFFAISLKPHFLNFIKRSILLLSNVVFFNQRLGEAHSKHWLKFCVFAFCVFLQDFNAKLTK